MREYEYTPPKPSDLVKLQKSLGFTGSQMAKLCGLSGSNRWRKYTTGTKPLIMTYSMLFLIAARLQLNDEQMFAVVEQMRKLGAMMVHIDPQVKVEPTSEGTT